MKHILISILLLLLVSCQRESDMALYVDSTPIRKLKKDSTTLHSLKVNNTEVFNDIVVIDAELKHTESAPESGIYDILLWIGSKRMDGIPYEGKATVQYYDATGLVHRSFDIDFPTMGSEWLGDDKPGSRELNPITLVKVFINDRVLVFMRLHEYGNYSASGNITFYEN